MEFKKFAQKVQEKFEKMQKTGVLFRSSVTGNELWEVYLNAFKDDPIFRDPSSSEHNCNHCSNFVRRYGNIVALNNKGQTMTMFGGLDLAPPYDVVARELNQMLKAAPIKSLFFESYEVLNSLPYEKTKKTQKLYQLGVPFNYKKYTKEEADMYGVVKEGQEIKFNHLNLQIKKQFISFTNDSVDSLVGKSVSQHGVLKRALETITTDTCETAIELIENGSLLDGNAHVHRIREFLEFKKEFKSTPFSASIFAWKKVKDVNRSIISFRNDLIGVFVTELDELGAEVACKNWNKRVDPVNYHKVKSPITQNQINKAKQFVEENDYEDSFNRRIATIDDIKVTEILHINNGNGEIKKVSVFDNVKSSSISKRTEKPKPKEISINTFMSEILPKASSLELYLEGRHEGNLSTITTAVDPDSKPIFKWDNNYSYTFNGNLAGKSQIKEAVKTRGGKTDGVLRFSIMWAENDPSDNSDLDAHCFTPEGRRIYYSDPIDPLTGCNLDVDIANPRNRDNRNIVENITFPFLQNMIDGTYSFIVHQYANRGSKGFKAEIEFNGNVYQYEYNKPVAGYVNVANVKLHKKQFKITHKIKPTNEASKELWGLDTNKFHKVNLMCLSPNHWGENAVGNKYFMFMLEECATKDKIRAFHNENLSNELMQHRKVMDVLGATTLIEPKANMLAGLGFNSTVRDNVIVRCKVENKNRVLKIKF